MSLIRYAVRVAAVEAVRGRTLVGGNVLDSENGSLDVLADGTLRTDQDRPFISIYSYDGEASGALGRSLLDNGTLEIAFEVGVASALAIRNDDTGERAVAAGLPDIDRAREFFLDLVGSQIRQALTDPGNPWGQVFLDMTTDVGSVKLIAVRHSDGQRVSAHQLMLTVGLIDDPAVGEALDAAAPFGRFLALLEASGDAVYTKQAEMIRLSLGDADDRDWHVLQQRLGLSAAELLALGRGPIAQDEEAATPEMTAGTIDLGDGRPVTGSLA